MNFEKSFERVVACRKSFSVLEMHPPARARLLSPKVQLEKDMGAAPMHMLGIVLMPGLRRLLIVAWVMLGPLAEPPGPQVQVRAPLL